MSFCDLSLKSPSDLGFRVKGVLRAPGAARTPTILVPGEENRDSSGTPSRDRTKVSR